MIKKNCNENFNFILKYYNRNNVVNNKLGVLITHIDDYFKFFKSKKNNNMNTFKRVDNNIENILNNTFTIEKRNERLYNFNNNENVLNKTLSNNTLNNENINNRNNNISNTSSFLNQNNNRFFNSNNFFNTSKSTNFKTTFLNSYSHF